MDSEVWSKEDYQEEPIKNVYIRNIGFLALSFNFLNILDSITTKLFLISGKGIEGNPVMAFLFNNVGVDVTLFAKIVIILIFTGWLSYNIHKVKEIKSLKVILLSAVIVNSIYFAVVMCNIFINFRG